ncbi:DNA-binding transcriptional regulator DsdC [Neisseriaceae bacterium JH1-16]|nr:DNA-binding transcriptional regulator DsdC [Neisseriaceae bacterium JH1-16]
MLNLPPRLAARLDSSQFANLHTFLAAARHLSFARAAEELCLSPSAVSHRIGRLERALGQRLFTRLTRQVRLTEAGERIFAILQGAVDQLAAALDPGSADEVAGPLALYASPSLAQCWLVPRLAGFTERYPAVAVDLRVGNEPVDFRTRQLDLALYYGDGDFPGLTSTRLMDEQLAPVCSPEYARRHGLFGQAERLRDCTLLHDALAWHHAAHDAEWTQWAHRHGLTAALPERSLSFDRADLCALAAVHHAGIALGRRRLVQAQLDRGELVLPFGPFSESGRYAYYLVHPPQAVLPRRLQLFIDWLHDCAAAG